MSSILSANTGSMADEASAGQTSQAEEPQAGAGQRGNEKLGIALVGLGSYSEKQLGPALKHTSHCELAAVVSGHAEKCEKWRIKYNLKDKGLYSYDNFDTIKSNDHIDIVYVVLPNALHAEFVVRAAEAGKHVICEKPMATTLKDCRRMIDACKLAGVRLSMGYRLHFDPINQEMMRLGQNELLGQVISVIAKNGMDVGDKNQWRLDQKLAGGGPLMDVGIYCVQGALYTIGGLPVAVSASFLTKEHPEKFEEVEEGMQWVMHFPGDKKALCETSYSKQANILRAETENSWFELQPAYEYKGLKGTTAKGVMNVAPVNQQAAQMDDFARCIKENADTRVPGEMGLRDMEILMAIYESARTQQRVELKLSSFETLIEI
jgi:predicted dehydrogenase